MTCPKCGGVILSVNHCDCAERQNAELKQRITALEAQLTEAQREAAEMENDLLDATESVQAWRKFVEEQDVKIRAAEARAGNYLEIIRALMTNPHLHLGDLVYNVREAEGKGWDGPSVTAWSNAVVAARQALTPARTEE